MSETKKNKATSKADKKPKNDASKYSKIAEQIDKLDKKTKKNKPKKKKIAKKQLKKTKLKEQEKQKKMEEERRRKLELKKKAKEEKKLERQKKLEEKKQEKLRKLEEKKRLREEALKRRKAEREKKKKERLKQLKLRKKAQEEKEKIEMEKKIGTEEKHEESPLQKTDFDQSKIDVVKNVMGREVINLKDESELSKVIEEVHEGGIIYERTGFGWKGLGSRRILFDEKLKQYVYEVIEPKLTKEEKELKNKLVHLFRIRADIDVSNMDEQRKKEYLGDILDDIIEKNHIKLDEKTKDKIYYYIYQEFVGYGKIDIPMHDDGIEDISCDGVNIPIFIYHKKFESIKSNIVFRDTEELDSFVIKLSQMCGKQISVYEPVVDGKLSDGSRLQVTLGKTITKDSTFTIRRFREDPLTPVDLVDNNTMSVEMAAYFWLVIENGASVLFCGGTASGKTTMLNALSLFLPTSYKIVSVEDTREINLPHENWIAGTTRTGFSSSEQSKTGKDIDMFDLIRVALRQRPRAIIVGEVRGKEAYTLFQAMTTGHLSYSTVHASDMHSLIQRLESPPINLPRSLLTSLDLVVFLNNLTIDGKPARRVTNVTEIIKLDPETNRLVTVSPFYWISEVEDRFRNTGGSKILNRIKLQNMWSDEKLEQELQNRIRILEWMRKNKIRSYTEVGKIISEYHNNPEELLKKIEDSK